MGKSVKKVLGFVGLAALIVITGGTLGLFAEGLVATLGATTVIGNLSALTLIGIGASLAVSIGFAPEIPDIQAARLLAENLSIQSSPNAIRSVIFGRSAIAGQLLFRQNIEGTDGNPDELIAIFALAGYSCTSLEKFWLNGVLVFNGNSTTGPGAVTTGVFANELWVYFRTGLETSQAFPAIASVSSIWAAKTRVLRGIPSIAIRLKVTEKLDGRLEPLSQVRGTRLYDPRKDSTVPGGSGTHRFDDTTTWEWSINAALPPLLYLRGAGINNVRIFGMGVPKARIDLEHWASEANICEEQVPVKAGGTINRYNLEGRLMPDQDHRKNLEVLLSASAGTMDASTGIYRLFVAAWRSPAMLLDEQDIHGAPSAIDLWKDPGEVVNIIRGVFADPNSEWEVKEYPELTDSASIAQVGENSVTMDLPFTTDHRTAQRLAKIRMFRANAQKKLGATYWLRVLALQPGDNVIQTYERYGFSAETMRINVWALESSADDEGVPRVVCTMQLVEEKQSWFSWDAATEEKTLTGVTALPAVGNAPKLVNLKGFDVLIFEGPNPPFNPKVGALWRDTDVDHVFRWNGSAWVLYATEGAPAGTSNQYSDGVQVDLLRPNEIGSDQTQPRIFNSQLINAGFELGSLEGWVTVVDNGSTRQAISTAPAFGSFHMRISGGTGTTRMRNVGRVPINPGSKALAYGLCKRVSGTGFGRVNIRFRDSGGALTGSRLGNAVTSNVYQESKAVGTAPANTATADFEFERSDGSTVDFDGALFTAVPKDADLDSFDGIGSLIELSSAGDGVNYRPLARGIILGSARDGNNITFDPVWSSVPTVIFLSGGGITFSDTLTGKQHLEYAALNLTGSGFTASLKIKELAGTITSHTDNVVSTPSVPSGVDQSINKTQSAQAWDDKYTYQYDVTLFQPPGEPPEPMSVGLYTNDGSGWVQRATKFITTSVNNRRDTIQVNGMGLNDDFGIKKEFGVAGTLNFDRVDYETAAAPVTQSATPSGASSVQFLVIGGS